MDKNEWYSVFDKYCKKLRIVPGNFAYEQFFHTLEATVEELTKCFLLEFGDHKALSYGRCRGMKSFNELYDGLQSLE